jgi:hypothetical protein
MDSGWDLSSTPDSNSSSDSISTRIDVMGLDA